MSLECSFCRIVSREEKGYVVFEDDISLAFLDRRPLFPGHCLLIPKEHIETFESLPGELLGPLFTNVQQLAQAVQIACGSQGFFIAVNNRVSQSVPHLHVHIVPRNRKDGLRGFFWPRNPYHDEDHIREVQQMLIKSLRQLNTKPDIKR